MFTHYGKLYLTTLAAFCAIDLVWLGVVARPFYNAQAGFLMAPTPDWVAVGLFYTLYALGILVFVIHPSLRQPSLRRALLRAAFFGFITYATYDLTNQATLKGWPWLLTVVDIAWGTVLNVATSAVVLWVGKDSRLKIQDSTKSG